VAVSTEIRNIFEFDTVKEVTNFWTSRLNGVPFFGKLAWYSLIDRWLRCEKCFIERHDALSVFKQCFSFGVISSILISYRPTTIMLYHAVSDDDDEDDDDDDAPVNGTYMTSDWSDAVWLWCDNDARLTRVL